MESDRSAGSVYRLVVNLSGRDVVYDASPFRSRKRAVAHVAAAVRRHAADGTIAAVSLEGTVDTADPATRRPSPANGNGRWSTLEQWDGVVIRRILDQWPVAGRGPGLPRATPPANVACEPSREADLSGCGDDQPGVSTRGAGERRRETDPDGCRDGEQGALSATRKGHRWHTVVMLVLAGLVWVSLAVLLAGGHLSSLFTDTVLPRPHLVSDLPFDAPAATEPRDILPSFGPVEP